MKCWKPRNDGKWRWIFFDGDAGLEELEHKTYDKALEEDEGAAAHATLFLRKLLENPTFKNKWLTRSEELLNTYLEYQYTEEKYQNIVPLVGNEIHRQIARFAVPAEYEVWREKLQNLQSFLAFRACEIQKQTEDHFGVNVYENICKSIEISIQNISIFPNPNSGNFTLTFNSSSTTAATISICNTLGQIVQVHNMVVEKGENTITFTNSHLPNGVLILNIFAEDYVLGTKMTHFGF